MSVATAPKAEKAAAPLPRQPQKPPGIVGRLMQLLTPQWYIVALSLLFGMASVALSLAGPKLLGRATDLIVSGVIGREVGRRAPGVTQDVALQYLAEKDENNLALIVKKLNVIPGRGIDFAAIEHVLLIALAIYMANVLCLFIQGRLIVVVVQRLVFDLRERLEDKLSRLPLSAFDTISKGEVLSRMTNDIDNIQRTLQQTVSSVLTQIFTVIGLLAVMYLIAPLLMAVVLVSVPLTLVLSYGIGKRARLRFGQQWAATGALNGYVEEMYTGHALVKGFGTREVVERDFDGHNAKMLHAAGKAQFLASSIEPGTRLITNLNYVAVAVVGALRIGSGMISVGDVQAFIQYSGQFGQSLAEVTNVAGVLQSGYVSAQRVFEILDVEEESPDPDEPLRLATVEGRVEFSRVSFSYSPDQPLIQDLNLVVEPGQTVAVVGESGAGKSTLGNLLLRFYELDMGRIMLDGVNIARMTRDDLRREIGLVSQDSWIFEGTIAENIAYGRPDASREEIEAAARAACVDRFVDTLPEGYDTILMPDSAGISTGQQQLVTVARVFLAEPRILLLDEATSSVDTRTELDIRQALAQLSEGRTSFVIAHRLSTIREADLILVMQNGNIVERGTHDELIAAHGHYARLYALGVPPQEPDDDASTADETREQPEPLVGRAVEAPAQPDLPPVPDTPRIPDGPAAAVGRHLAGNGLASGTFYPPASDPEPIPVVEPDYPPAKMHEAITGLRGSITHHLSIEAYQRHVDKGDRTCAWCGRRTPCMSRLDAAAVIEAAGEDPHQYDPRPDGLKRDFPTVAIRRLPPPDFRTDD